MNWRLIFRWLLAVFFIASGSNHFRALDTYRMMVPPWLPDTDSLIYLSGGASILGGIGVLVPAAQRWAGCGLIVLLIAVFPANLHLAFSHVALPGWEIPLWVRWARLPLQAAFIAWVWWTTIAPGRDDTLD
jgi:uncharacterized membrane protein